MSKQVNATWVPESWEEHNYLEPDDGPPLIHADVKRDFHGEFEGKGVAILLCCRPDEGQAGYVATEYITGSLLGRAGSFVVQFGAVMGGREPQSIGFVVPGSGTGELKGLTGECAFGHDEAGKAFFRLDYDLD